MAVQNAGCVFVYFCGGRKIIFGCNFAAPSQDRAFLRIRGLRSGGSSRPVVT